MIEDTPWNIASMTYDIFCFHFIWNHAEVSGILGMDAVYFTMIRHPVDLFLSAWDYFKFGTAYNMTLEQFAKAFNTTSIGNVKDPIFCLMILEYQNKNLKT